MKKSLSFVLCVVMLAGFVVAAQGRGNQVRNQNAVLDNKNLIQARQRIGNRARMRIQNVSFECPTGCNLSEKRVQNRSRLNMRLSNGRNAEIKVMPSVASETALARLRIRNCNESNGCMIELKSVGKENKTRAAYEIRRQRSFKILGLFRKRAWARVRVDAETGNVISIKKPWWAFLASEPEEE